MSTTVSVTAYLLLKKRMRRQHCRRAKRRERARLTRFWRCTQIALLQQTLSIDGSHEKEAECALWAKWLEVEAPVVSLAAAAVGQAHSQGVEALGVLRAALVGAAPGLGEV